jgi:hypothetical protein
MVTSVVIGVPLVWTVYFWLAKRRGPLVGAIGGGMTALSPTVLAASSLATTDACFALFALLALGALRRYQDHPSRRSFAGLGVALGLAFGAKQSSIFLVPVVLMELILKSVGRGGAGTRVDACLRTLWRSGWRLVALGLIAFVVNWALFGFGFGPPFEKGNPHVPLPIVVPMVADLLPNGEAVMRVVNRWGTPLPVETFFGLLNKASTGHSAFLMGEHSFHGWWYFFPVAVALKSTPAELVLLGLTAALAARPRNWVDPARRLWLGSIVVIVALGVSSSMNYGHRHMILLYPLCFLLACDVLCASQWIRTRTARLAAVGCLLLSWQAVSAFGVAPHYLGYFNSSFCGGPMQGYRYLVDSSLDWGQDLPTLRRELEARGYHKVALCYFGTALPEAYGLRSIGWDSFEGPIAAGCDWLAISATELQGVYALTTERIELFGPLPSARAGYSIFMYDLKDPRVRKALAVARRHREPQSAGE